MFQIPVMQKFQTHSFDILLSYRFLKMFQYYTS